MNILHFGWSLLFRREQQLYISAAMELGLVEVATQKELHAKLSQGSRTGSTIDPKRRAGEYRREGWTGTMYYCKTSNMRFAEDKLLKACNCPANKQRKSNVSEDPGYVYLIVESQPTSWWSWCIIL